MAPAVVLSEEVKLAAHVGHLSSVANPFVKHVVKLRQSSAYRYASGSLVLVGDVPLRELCDIVPSKVANKAFIEYLFLLEGSNAGAFLAQFAQRVVKVTPGVMHKLSGVQPTQGCNAVGITSLPSSLCCLESSRDYFSSLSSWCPCSQRLLVLDGIQDPGNLGTLLRTAAAFDWCMAFKVSFNVHCTVVQGIHIWDGLGLRPPKEDSLQIKQWRTPIKSSNNSLKASRYPRRKPMLHMKGHLQRREKGGESQDESMEDVAPRRRRAQRSPTPPKWKRSPHSPHRRESKREEKSSKKKKERKRSPSSSPSSYCDESSGCSSQEKQRRGHRRSYATWKRSSKLKKFKEGGKNISFLTYDGTFGATDKVLAFIQQFDAAFGDEDFTKSSKLRHVAMHFQKSARQWWASLRANGEAPKTWKALRASIMKQFLASDAKDKVLTKWIILKLTPYESVHEYVDKF
ncbi:hypothetical protein L7F22_032234 [Adiantum nelumboides]|nr:hypothetical protein [Adiantum nelumboides]